MAALEGLKVLDLSRVLAGPWSAMTLADLGADVIKVEPPGGDDTRALGPPFLGELSAYFACANRNKRSIMLDLKQAPDRGLLDELIRWADVLIENYRTGVDRHLGVDYARLHELNPRLIHCSITGYGRSGTQAERPGYDFVVQAEAGLMSITGDAERAPQKVGVAVADLFTGQNATTAILAALWQRQRTGRGQHIDVSLFDSQLQMLANVASSCLFDGSEAKRYGNAHAAIVPYQSFAAADGEFALAVASDKLWHQLCAAIDAPELADDPRFASNPDRVRHRAALIPLLEAHFATKPVAHWLDRLGAAEVPCAGVNGVRAALDLPLTSERGMRVDIDGVPMVGSPLHLSDSPVEYRRAPPLLDADRDSVLRELGLR